MPSAARARLAHPLSTPDQIWLLCRAGHQQQETRLNTGRCNRHTSPAAPTHATFENCLRHLGHGPPLLRPHESTRTTRRLEPRGQFHHAPSRHQHRPRRHCLRSPRRFRLLHRHYRAQARLLLIRPGRAAGRNAAPLSLAALEDQLLNQSDLGSTTCVSRSASPSTTT